jgi:eukaryotic-like serine/threonine-protein kinase
VTVAAGTRLGPYEIIAPLGAGGMGEVYRARDTRLGRDVAVKVLPSTFSADPDRLQRFEREACAAGALNHPNILAIYDVGKHDSSPYVVSELLEGETLRKRITGMALPQRRAVEYALQIAHGLAAAHEKGIVHRDLKPDNIFITKDGRVKILDFGLAKLTQANSDQPQTEIPTRRVDTDPGVVMGTVGYMSPEQVRGQRVDQRTDIFSFGAVLYEMLSGRRAFHAESAADTMSAILKEDPPDLSEMNHNVSPALERLVNHCLEKNPEGRFHSARDLAFALEAASSSSDRSLTTGLLPARPINRERLAWAVAGVLLLGLVLTIPFAFAYFRRTPLEASVVSFSVSLPEKLTFTSDVEQNILSVSPDGRWLAFVAVEGQRMLWVRSLGSLNARRLEGTEGAFSPFWSPDSRFVAFFAGGKLKKVEAAGGAVQALCDVPEGDKTGTWGHGDVILFDGEGADFRGLYRMSAVGGTPSPMLRVDSPTPYWPHLLPDGRHFLFLVQRKAEGDGIYIGSLDSQDKKFLVPAVSRAEYAPPGYVLYVREGNLLAQSFDLGGLRTTGEPLVIAERLQYFTGTGRADFSVSENGVIAFLNKSPYITRLAWFDRGGREVGVVGEPAEHYNIRISPDGQRVGVAIADEHTFVGDLWVYDLARNTRTRVTFTPEDDDAFVWSPDGRRVAFFSWRAHDKPSLYLKELTDAGDGDSPLAAGWQSPSDWSTDGRFIIYRENDPTIGGDLWALPLFGEQKPFPFLRTRFSETMPRFSPDGRWVAFASNESGRYELYVARFERPAEKWRVSTAGGTQPRWRRDGRELFYLAPGNQLMAVAVRPGETFESGAPSLLFKIDLDKLNSGGEMGNDYDVTADGQRFLVVISAAAHVSPFTVIANWTADLTR